MNAVTGRFAILGFGPPFVRRLLPALRSGESGYVSGNVAKDQARALKNGAYYHIPQASLPQALCFLSLRSMCFLLRRHRMRMHRTIRCWPAPWKAVLCEKPPAMNAAEAEG